jgi:hypothetical protein
MAGSEAVSAEVAEGIAWERAGRFRPAYFAENGRAALTGLNCFGVSTEASKKNVSHQRPLSLVKTEMSRDSSAA